MTCLYCGKEIGPIQLLRDDEFCSADHRKRYANRLGRGLRLVAVPEPAPEFIAGFLPYSALQTGRTRSFAADRLRGAAAHAIETAAPWLLRVPPVLGSQPKPLPAAEPSTPEDARPRVHSCSFVAEERDRDEGLTGGAALSKPALAFPPLIQRPVRGAPAASPAPCPARPDEGPRDARPSSPRRLLLQPREIELAIPRAANGAAPAGPDTPPICQNWKAACGPEAAAREIRPTHCPPRPWPHCGHEELPASVAAACQSVRFGTATLLPIPQPDEAARTAAAAVLSLTEKSVSHVAALPEFAGLRPTLDRLAPAEPRPPMPLEFLIAKAGLHLWPGAVPTRLPEGKLAALPPFPPALSVEVPAPEPQASSAVAPEIGPPAGFIPLEYYSHRARSGIRLELAPLSPQPRVQPPAFCLNAVKAIGQDASRKKPSDRRARVVAMRAAPARTRSTSHAPARNPAWHALGAIAAGLILGAVIWTGIGEVRRPRHTDAALEDASAQYAANLPAAPLPASAPAAALSPGASRGPLGWVRKAVAGRAAVELTDSFRTGMEAWGMPAKSWAPGWSRHPDGYVRTGQLSVFRPSGAYRDYRLEFFAQIEKKSVGWVVRARDNRNYYAMKLTVIDPGLRPVVAIVHYPVVGGKPGRRIEIPLSTMVHNNEAIHVAVDVKGKRVITSLEGQEVDSWTDDTLATGGVGFFSEAGEQARLYWMKVAANNDLLGRVCARVAGAIAPATQAVTAPAQPGAPFAPGPLQPEQAALAAAVGYVRNRRKQSWNS